MQSCARFSRTNELTFFSEIETISHHGPPPSASDLPSEPTSTFTELKKVTSDSFSATGLCAGGAADTAPGRTSWAPGSSHDVSERRRGWAASPSQSSCAKPELHAFTSVPRVVRRTRFSSVAAHVAAAKSPPAPLGDGVAPPLRGPRGDGCAAGCGVGGGSEAAPPESVCEASREAVDVCERRAEWRRPRSPASVKPPSPEWRPSAARALAARVLLPRLLDQTAVLVGDSKSWKQSSSRRRIADARISSSAAAGSAATAAATARSSIPALPEGRSSPPRCEERRFCKRPSTPPSGDDEWPWVSFSEGSDGRRGERPPWCEWSSFVRDDV